MTFSDDDEEAVLQHLIEMQNNKTPDELIKCKSDDEVFRQIYIPRTLQELSIEEVLKLKGSNHEEIYAKLTGFHTAQPLADHLEEAKAMQSQSEAKVETNAEPSLEEVKEEMINDAQSSSEKSSAEDDEA